MKKPRSYPCKIRGVSYSAPSETPILIYLDILDPTTKFGHRGSTIRLTQTEAASLRDSLTRHLMRAGENVGELPHRQHAGHLRGCSLADGRWTCSPDCTMSERLAALPDVFAEAR